MLTRAGARDCPPQHLELAKSHIDAIDLVLSKGITGDGDQAGAARVAKLEQRVAELVG